MKGGQGANRALFEFFPSRSFSLSSFTHKGYGVMRLARYERLK